MSKMLQTTMVGLFSVGIAASAMGCVAYPAQQHMNGALAALQDAQSQLGAAEDDKGGHRVNALSLVSQAESQIQAGEEFAAEHPGGGDTTEDLPPPVNDVDPPGLASQPHMATALSDLRAARDQLRNAAHDKGGYRFKALQAVNQAIEEVKAGVGFATGQ